MLKVPLYYGIDVRGLVIKKWDGCILHTVSQNSDEFPISPLL